MTIMQPNMKITVVFIGNDSQTRHKWTLFSNAETFIDAAKEVTEFIAQSADDTLVRGPEAWITGMEIERVR